MPNAAMKRVATHRPALARRRYKHDEVRAGDLFSGFGGLTKGLELAGCDVIVAANHNAYKVEVHEANHPSTEHWIADLANPDSSDYHSVRDLPAVDLLAAGVTCTNHSPANTRKAYRHGLTLFDLDDPDYDDRVTRSERDRATATCVLQYAAHHHPRVIVVECTTELQSWGNLVPGKRKVGDGSTYRWWLREFGKLGYRHRVLFLNSMHFGVGQSRDRGFWVFWDERLPAPDLDHRPPSWCSSCDRIVEAVWSWRTGVPPTGRVAYGKQYDYRCPSCRREVVPPFTPSLDALDLSDLGTRIGDRAKPLAAATMARAERCRQRFAEFPAVLMPAKTQRGVERHPWQPMSTQTSQQETAVLSTGALMAAAGNSYERPGSDCRTRDLSQPLPAQTATNGTGVVTPPVAVAVDNFQGAPRGVDEPLPTQPGSQNGSTGVETAPHPVTDPLGTLTSRDTTALLSAEWREALAELALEDCYFRMMGSPEIGRGCGFDVDHPNRPGRGTFIVWGSAREQVDGYGNAVTPAIGHWIGGRLLPVLHPGEAA